MNKEEEQFDEEQFREEFEQTLEEDVAEEKEVEEHSEEASEEYSEVEMEAMKHGWRPEGVEGKRNLSAEEFLDRQKLYDEIKHLKKGVKETKLAFDALRKHHQRVREAERKKIIAELKLQKRMALETDDYDKVMELDDKILEASTKQDDGDDIPDIPETNSNEAFETWVSENRWYHADKDLRTRADIVGAIYYQNNPTAPLDDVYNYVTETMRKEFPEKFGITSKQRKPSTAAVDTSSRRTTKASTGAKKFSSKDLPEDALQIMKTLVRSGAVTEEQYLKEYYESA